MSENTTVELRLEMQELKGQKDLLERDLKNIDKRLSGIEDTLKWLVRLVIGALIMAVIGFALKGGLVIG